MHRGVSREGKLNTEGWGRANEGKINENSMLGTGKWCDDVREPYAVSMLSQVMPE